MLSPEIWAFKAPYSSFQIKKHEVSEYSSCFQTIQKFPFNHLISIVLPNTLRTPKVIQDLLNTDCEYYKVSDLSLEELAKTTFVNNFVRKGALSILSIDKKIDTDNCFCISANGLMILSLCKESYETFGLEGTASHYFNKSKERYIVRINLLNLKTGTKRYEKTKQCLKRLENFSFIVNWEPPQDNVCPSSIAKYFSELQRDVKLCVPHFNHRTHYSVKVPALENIHDFTEWLGMLSLEVNLEDTDSYLTNYETPTPFQEYGQVKFIMSKGFFTCGLIKKLVEVLKTMSKTEDVPWISLYVQGFSDSAISWDGQEHQFYTNGDNSYLLIITPEHYWVICNSCSKKSYK